MNLHKHQLYLLEQHSESFKRWSAIIRINTEGKSLIKIGPCGPKSIISFINTPFKPEFSLYQEISTLQVRRATHCAIS